MIIASIGGPTVVKEVFGFGSDKAAIVASETRIKEEISLKIDEARKVEIEERAKITSAQERHDEMLAYQAGFLCALNEGKPHRTFPCDGFTAEQKALGQTRKPPWYRTETPYPSATKTKEEGSK